MTFNYDELLKRACAQMPHVSEKVERLELPRLFVNTVGMRTIISNFKEVADALDRDPQHLKF
jgi:translation initiation factor 2 subunit 2